ncbi:fimbria/pilus outer membrane usher protein [Serratia aquatilis]|uniref:Fimbria/pilus outer membrane usher protein n=2 Tax=Serratia aquatilis TaxID=1737515 RepID=A0ABV6EH85_9GAMM
MRIIKPRQTDCAVFRLLAVSTVLVSFSAMARDYFDPGLLTLSGVQPSEIDLSLFETPGKIPPGNYVVNLYVNQVERGQFRLDFKPDSHGNIQPGLTPELLQQLGINTKGLPAFAKLSPDSPVQELDKLIPASRVKFDFSQLRLDLSIPQIAMQPNVQDAVDPALWDEGVSALLFNYTLNGGRNWQREQAGMVSSTMSNLFANVQGGANWQAWRLRSTLTYMHNAFNQSGQAGQTTRRTQFINTFLQRDIPTWRSAVLVGENSTDNAVFDSIPFRGIRLNSSDDMLPNSQRGFAPVITGIAQSNARVTVSENGNVIYQTYVAPGPFRINDLYQTGPGGDLTLTITEADGTVRTQRIAVSSLPVMRRPGSLKYELTAGRYNGGLTEASREAHFVQGTAIYGLPHDVTLYGGTLVAKDYGAMVLGTGISLGAVGALSADITTSSARLHQEERHQQGTSYRLRFAKSLQATGTSIDLAAYRYSTRHYYSFADFNSLDYLLNSDQAPWNLERQRSTVQVRVSQQLGHFGSLYMDGSHSDYWGNSRVLNTLSAGYNVSYRGVSYGLAYSIDSIKGEGDWAENRQLLLNVQVPLNLFSSSNSGNPMYASYQMTQDNLGQIQQQAGINGSALDNRLSYSAMQGWSNGIGNNTSTLNFGYQGGQGTITAGYSNSSAFRSLNLGGSGGIVIHPYGITLGQMLGSSVAVVNAAGAGGSKLIVGNIQTDSRGYAVVPYLSNYQSNSISLDPSTLPENVDMGQSSVNVYPTWGAVVMANFSLRVGYQALVTLQHQGAPLSFGALVTVKDTAGSTPNTGIVGDGGQVYLSGLQESGTLWVKWGNGGNQQCHAAYNLTEIPADTPIRVLKANCQ